MSQASEMTMRMTKEMETKSTEVRFSNLKASPPIGFVRFQKGAAENPPPFRLASFAAFRSIVARSSA